MIDLGPEQLGGPVRVVVGDQEVVTGTLVEVRHRLDDQGQARTTLDVDTGEQVVTVLAPPQC